MAMTMCGYVNYKEILRHRIWRAARDGDQCAVLNFLQNIIRENLVEEIINHHRDEDGQSTTPLIIAAMNGNEKVVEVLLNFGAKIDKKGTVIVDDYSRGGATALWCASCRDHYNIVKLLVENGADINLPTDDGSTPLRPPCVKGNFEIVQYLVEHGANVNAVNDDKETCLMIASYKGQHKIVPYLLEKGASPEYVNIFGTTALHESAESGHLTISKLLAESGVTISIKDNYGITPLMKAAINQKCRVVEYLSSLPECQNKDQIDALDL